MLAPLIVVMVLAAFVLLIGADLMAPHSSLMRAIDHLAEALPHREVSHRHHRYGACGDICSAAGACRHVRLQNGLHGGDRVSAEVLQAAESCH